MPAGSPSPRLAGFGSRPVGPEIPSRLVETGQGTEALRDCTHTAVPPGVAAQKDAEVKDEPMTDDEQEGDVGLDTAGVHTASSMDGANWWRGVSLQQSGPVVRHASLQTKGAPDAEAARVRRRREDKECTAGLRNPADAIRRLPGSITLTRDLFCCLRRARTVNPDLQGLHRAGGPEPSRAPPRDQSVACARREFGRCLDVMPGDAEAHHPAAPWRHMLFGALAARLNDPDQEVPTWLADGAPMGLAAPIRRGGHFPVLTEAAELPADR